MNKQQFWVSILDWGMGDFSQVFQRNNCGESFDIQHVISWKKEDLHVLYKTWTNQNQSETTSKTQGIHQKPIKTTQESTKTNKYPCFRSLTWFSGANLTSAYLHTAVRYDNAPEQADENSNYRRVTRERRQ